MELKLAGELQRCLYSRTVAGFGVWWCLQCIVGPTVAADGSAGWLVLEIQTPVTVASAAALQWSWDLEGLQLMC